MTLDPKYAECRKGRHVVCNVESDGNYGRDLTADCMVCGANLDADVSEWSATYDETCATCEEAPPWCGCPK